MSALDDLANADAAAISAMDGTPIEYRPGGDAGAAVTVKVFPVANPVSPRATDGRRTLEPALLIEVAKTDMATPARNSDTVLVPSEWLGKAPGSTVEVRISSIDDGLSMPGFWRLSIG